VPYHYNRWAKAKSNIKKKINKVVKENLDENTYDIHRLLNLDTPTNLQTNPEYADSFWALDQSNKFYSEIIDKLQITDPHRKLKANIEEEDESPVESDDNSDEFNNFNDINLSLSEEDQGHDGNKHNEEDDDE